MADEYIKREDGLNAMCAICMPFPATTHKKCDMAKCAEYCAVARVPAADVAPVVRCKDCKHYQITENGEYACVRDADEKDGVWFGFIQNTPPLWFCADGERKGGGE